MYRIIFIAFVLLLACCKEHSETNSEESHVQNISECTDRWKMVNDSVIHNESEEFKMFISPIDSIERLIQSKQIRPKKWEADSIEHTQFVHENKKIKLVRKGKFDSYYTHEYYPLDQCNVMLIRTDKYLDYPDSIQRIRIYAFNRDSICRAYVTSPSMGYAFQANITENVKTSYNTIRTWFENEMGSPVTAKKP